MYRFLIIIEKSDDGFRAYCPDLVGCAATGANREEVEKNMRGAVEAHIRGLLEEGLPIPESRSIAEYVIVEEYVGS